MSTASTTSAGPRARPSTIDLALTALALVSACVIAVVQPWLARETHAVKRRDDVSALPPPKQLKAMTLGYHAAAADLLWAKLIVEWGLAHQEKRPFPDLRRFLDGILEVEPDFPTLFSFVDTLLVYGPTPGTAEDARDAKTYLVRGTQTRPYDHEVWLHYGQFAAFLGPSFLTDEAEIQAWRKEGAFALMRAVELGSDPDRSLAAGTILAKSGEKTAVLMHLRRSYALADDPETRRNLLFKIRKIEDSPEGEEAVDVVEREWRSRYGFVSRGTALLIGPSRNAAACAGPASYGRKECPRDWNALVNRP